VVDPNADDEEGIVGGYEFEVVMPPGTVCWTIGEKIGGAFATSGGCACKVEMIEGP